MTEAFATPFARRRRRLAVAPATEFPLPGRQTDLRSVSGFLVVDSRGRLVGRVEGPTFDASFGTSAAMTVSFGFLWLRRCLVAAESIEQIDDGTKVIGLRIDRKALRVGRA
jgi:hypothetical protein